MYQKETNKKTILDKAENHSLKALNLSHNINLIEMEADILLELGKIRILQKKENEALYLTNEALKIADRCEYRLQQADIHLFLAQLSLDQSDIISARKEADIAIERASCGYKPTLLKAQKLKESIL